MDIDEETTNFVNVCNYDKHIIDILCCDDRRENSDLPQILEEYRQEMLLKRGISYLKYFGQKRWVGCSASIYKEKGQREWRIW